MPPQHDANILVGLDSRDDAGVYALPTGQILVQTIDFFTPVVDDPYSFGAIAAANALSDIYAMGGHPLTALNVSCFDPAAAPSQVWADILHGMADKTRESGAAILGGHSVEDDEPKFGMAVTGLVNRDHLMTNRGADPGQNVYLSKPLGTGIVTTAAKFDKCLPEELEKAIDSMSLLNRVASESCQSAGVNCATDITGFGLVGHLWNVARESQVTIEVNLNSLPLLPGLHRMISEGCVTGGAVKNRDALGPHLQTAEGISDWLLQVAYDPQTSGGLAATSNEPIPGFTEIGRVCAGEPLVRLIP